MKTYLERYLQGEYEEVWAELVAMGNAIYQEPLYQDALAVARETMRRANENVKTLNQRLLDIKYQFFYSPFQYRPANVTKNRAALAQIEEIINGRLPLSLICWYEFVEEVSFVGEDFKCNWSDSAERLASKNISEQGRKITELLNPDFPPSDPLVIFDPSATLENLENTKAHYEGGYFSAHNMDLYFGLLAENRPPIEFDFVISGNAISKSHQQNGVLTLAPIPNPGMDVVLVGDVVDNTTFIQYLRNIFRWGGFPEIDIANPETKNLIAYLSKDLLPI